MEKEIIKIIKQHRYKNFKKLNYYLKQNNLYSDVKRKDIKDIFDNYNKKHAVKHYNKNLMGNKFSSIPNAWQMDVFKVGSVSEWLLLVNINTKFAWTKEIIRTKKPKKDKPQKGGVPFNDIINHFNEFVMIYKPKVIETDEEKAFVGLKMNSYMREHNIIHKTVPNWNHEYLSVINKLCQTLSRKIYYKDNINEESEESDEIKDDNDEEVDFKQVNYDDKDEHDIANGDVDELVDEYNNTYNDAIKMTPNEMMKNKEAQYEWIYNQLMLRDTKEKMLLNEPLEPKKDKVLYLLDIDRGAKKFEKDQRRYEYSEDYYYLVKQRTPYLYEICGKDGVVKAVPRYRLLKLENTKSKRLARSVNDELAKDRQIKDTYYFVKIIDYKTPPKAEPTIDNCKYEVKIKKYKPETKSFSISLDPITYSVYQLRKALNHPTNITELEREFLKNNEDKYKYDSEKHLIVPLSS